MNILEYNNLIWNLLKNKVSNNEWEYFAHEVLDYKTDKIIDIVTYELLNCDVDYDIQRLVIDITNNKRHINEIFRRARSVFLSYGYEVNIKFDYEDKEYLEIIFK